MSGISFVLDATKRFDSAVGAKLAQIRCVSNSLMCVSQSLICIPDSLVVINDGCFCSIPALIENTLGRMH